ncbi:Na+ dependent nucleoside transporter C-terminus-domain-containing protein [Cokeromyces recurvatus]|uniref:Na+ dependent nucleoside transporter C-terminus-domain-containing protein n=1 Tax=Cokeromyces recurvatus TaxID=90255 RepID=UPI002220D29D|nr:Na+ dependent nucleoside transporter C-terminus-domain-containing protein [Cokeromyces recurvatus]KAI7907774.1 Na+ dependent nucleoside transporter C-terminus-domain-containing protein [Cokeromyces recurvatus]
MNNRNEDKSITISMTEKIITTAHNNIASTSYDITHHHVLEEKKPIKNNNNYRLSKGIHSIMNKSDRAIFYQKYKVYIHFLTWLLLTAFVCVAFVLQIPKGYNQELLILGIVYTWISLYLLFCYMSTTIITDPWKKGIKIMSNFLYEYCNQKWRTICLGICLVIIVTVTVFSFPEKQESPRIRRLIPLFGMFIFIFSVYITSVHRRFVQWNTIFIALLLQFVLALFVFRTSVGHDIFQWIAGFAEGYLHNAGYGAAFLFGETAVQANTFALNVFPAIIFFGSTVQMLYYLGTIQWLLKKLSIIFISILSISGAESIVAVASPFLGATENVLLIKPLVPQLTKSEIHQILTSGFSTISGSVLYGYIAMGISGQALLTSCIMSIPCSIAISKLRYPETDNPVTKDNVSISSKVEEEGEGEGETANILHAAGKGAEVGIKIVLLIMANIISILAILYAVNGFLTWLGNFLNIQNLTLQLITGYLFVPIAWLMGTDNKDLVIVGRLMATKIWSNEFIAYKEMTATYAGQLSARSQIIATYALCGFANFGSVGMQVGVLSTLAPLRSGDISSLAISALICGTLSTWLSASIAGMLL